MQYLNMPNLPDRKVKSVLISPDCPADILEALTSYGVNAIKSARNLSLKDATSTHPDMNILHLGENQFICNSTAIQYYKKVLPNTELTCLKEEVRAPYPMDIPLNVAIVGKFVFLNKKTLNEQIFEEVMRRQLQIIDISQGYAKCNIAVVSDKAIITEDTQIAKKAKENEFDVLLLQPGQIYLNGYAHGFIGGACGKLAPDCLAITGTIDNSVIRDEIRSFCRNYSVELLKLSKTTPTDLGSILPIA